MSYMDKYRKKKEEKKKESERFNVYLLEIFQLGILDLFLRSDLQAVYFNSYFDNLKHEV